MKFGWKTYSSILFHRWIRLWPAYFIAILFYWKISVYFGSGPLWWSYVSAAQECDSTFWTNMLLLDNVLNVGFPAYCFPWGWYLACDFQMFLIAPFICWIHLKNRTLNRHIMWSLMTISIILSYAYIANSGYTYVLMPKSSMGNDFLIDYYENTAVRLPPYLIGLWLGFMFKDYKQGQQNIFSWTEKNLVRSASSALLGIGTLIFIIFFPNTLQTGTTWSDGFAITWSILTRPLWAIGLFLIMLPCLVGKLKTLSEFLGNYYFVLISRLSYSGYLIHLIILSILTCDSDQIFGSSEAYQSAIAFGIMLVACAVAMVLYLCVEKPIMNLETQVMQGKKRK